MALNFPSSSTDAGPWAKARCDAGKKLQCLRESCRGEATPKQGRAMSEKVSGGSSKPSGRAGLEQLQDRVRTG